MSKITKHDETLRGMVRDVLQDVLASRGQLKSPAHSSSEAVRIETDAELQNFLRRVTDAATAQSIRDGRLRFTLSKEQGSSGHGQLLEGVITEQKIDGLAGAGLLLLGPGAVLTPLAKDRARRLGLKIERRR